MNNLLTMIRALRPNQWTKNVFVFTGIIFGKALHTPGILVQVILAAIAFSLVSSCIYIINDIIDCESDRKHPEKCHRPLASGAMTISTATLLAAAAGIGGVAIGLWVSKAVTILLLCYLALNTAYSLRLKHVVILDVFCISAGFMLRILAGTIGVGIPPSNWLLLCGLMITLFLGFAKRRAETLTLDDKQEHRQVLGKYSPLLLDEMITICATGVIIGYSLYTMSADTIRIHNTANLIYTIPFVIYALFRYLYLLHLDKKAGDPTTTLFKDPHIVTTVIGWAAVTYYLLQ